MFLTACGGGGGGSNNGSGSGTAPGTPAFAALTFSPGVASATMESGQSATVSVNASVNRPSDFNGGQVYALIVDTNGVLLPNATFSSQSPTQYTALLQTSPVLVPGDYKGNITVNLCRDQACREHYPGSPMQLPYAFNVKAGKLAALAASPLSATLNKGAAAPPPVRVRVVGAVQGWNATTTAPWLVLSEASGSGDGSFTVGYDLDKVAEGTVSGSISVVANDGQRVVLPVSLTMIAKVFSVTQSGYTFSAVNGAPINPQQVSFSLEGGAAWTANSDVPWLAATPASGTLPGQLELSVNPALGLLASGQHTGNLILRSPTGKDRSLSVSLNLTKPVLSLSTDNITLGGTFGRDFAAKSLSMSLNTMKNNWPWTLGTLPNWANVSARSGQVNQDGTIVQISANLNTAAVGSSSVVLEAGAQVNGDKLSRPVTLTIHRDQQKIIPSESGLAMVSVPGWSRLVRTVTVSDNFGANTAWSASSNQPWLSVSRSGNQLTLTGDPATLPADATSYATVTLSTSVPGVVAPEVVRVALWKGSKAPAVKTEIKNGYQYLIADAIRPVVYVHGGGGAIDAYNVYTGQKVAASATLAGKLAAMAVSQNGDRLYVYDTANHNILVLNPQTLAKLETWNLRSEVSGFANMLSIRPNGEEVLLTTVGEAFRAANGQRVAVNYFGYAALAGTRDGKQLYSQVDGISPSTALAYDVDFSAIGGGTLHLQAHARSFSGGSNGADIAVSLDGKRLYTANGAPYRCAVAEVDTMRPAGSLPGGDAYPNNVEVDSFGRVYCGISGVYSSADVWMHDSNGAVLKTFKFAGYARALLSRQMAVSADGMMLIGLTEDPNMAIMSVGP